MRGQEPCGGITCAMCCERRRRLADGALRRGVSPLAGARAGLLHRHGVRGRRAPSFRGAVAGGGRYDDMVGKFLGQKVPAVGFSIGFERICSILLEQGYAVPQEKQSVWRFCTARRTRISPAVLQKAAALRGEYAVTVLAAAKKPGKQYERLAQRGFAAACLSRKIPRAKAPLPERENTLFEAAARRAFSGGRGGMQLLRARQGRRFSGARLRRTRVGGPSRRLPGTCAMHVPNTPGAGHPFPPGPACCTQDGAETEKNRRCTHGFAYSACFSI